MSGQGVGVEGAKRSKKVLKPPEIVKNGTNNRWLPTLIDLKIVDMQLFLHKTKIYTVLTRCFMRHELNFNFFT
jgi:hypothetical protein